MTTHLNALINNLVSVDVAALAITGTDVAHHLIDPDGVLGLDPLHASELEQALPIMVDRERTRWILALPAPGNPSSLRGPQDFNLAAIEAGQAVVAEQAGIGLVPHVVGRGVQWQAFRANPPFTPPTPYDAERLLAETVISAARTLTALDAPSGSRPLIDFDASLAPGYPARRRATADRAARLLAACDAAMADDTAVISSFELDTRHRELRRLREVASLALCAACSWPEDR